MTSGPPGPVSHRRVLCPLRARSGFFSQYPFLFGLHNIFYLSSRPAHPIFTLSLPRHLCCSYNTYYIYNTHQARSHAPILSLTPYHTVLHSHSPLAFSRSISICALLLLFVPFLSLSFFFLSFCLLPIFHCLLLDRVSALALSSVVLTHSLSLSLTICFRGIASIWNLGNAAVQKPGNEAKLAHKESPFCVRCGYTDTVDSYTRLTESEGSPTARYCFPHLGMHRVSPLSHRNNTGQVKGTAIKGRLMRCGQSIQGWADYA